MAECRHVVTRVHATLRRMCAYMCLHVCARVCAREINGLKHLLQIYDDPLYSCTLYTRKII